MDNSKEGVVTDKDMGPSYNSKIISDDPNQIKVEPTNGGQIITNGPVSPLHDESDPNWDKLQSDVMQMIKPPSPNHGTVATTEPSVVSDLMDDNKPNTTKVGTLTGEEESTNGTVLVVSSSASNARASGTPTGTGGSDGTVLDVTLKAANGPTNLTEFRLQRTNPSTRNVPVTQSQFDRRKAIANKKRKMKKQGLHVRSRPYMSRKTKAFISKTEQNRFKKKLFRRVCQGDVKGVCALQPPPSATHALRDRYQEFINMYVKWAAKVDRRLRPYNTANGARLKFMSAMRSRECRQLASPEEIRKTIHKF